MLLFFILIQLFASSYGSRQNITGLIVNGEPAVNYIPYQASIRVSMRDYLRFGRGHTCGGVLINSRTILTAAHCLMNGPILRTPLDVHVVLGSLNRLKFTQETVIGYAEKVIMHPYYLRDRNFAHDIGIIILRRPIEFNDIIQPIDLIDYEIEADTNCQVSGWGDLEWRGLRPIQLQKANVSIFDRTACNSSTSYNGRITLGMVCANGQTSDGRIIDLCQGDSGGPLVCNNLLVGLASFGVRCGASFELPGVFVDIYYYRNWIIQHQSGASIQKSHKTQLLMFTFFLNLIWILKL